MEQNRLQDYLKLEYIGIFFLAAGLFFSSVLAGIHYRNVQDAARVLSVSDNVVVSVSALPCELQVRAVPEKRVNSPTNLQSSIDFEIYGSALSDFRGSTTKTTSNVGLTDIDLCNEGVTVNIAENIDMYVTGQSHVTKKVDVDGEFTTVLTYVDTETLAGQLIAGETHPIFNNVINELDLSTQIVALNTNDLINDLNQDGVVNELDLSNTIFNLNVQGDCSPQQTVNGVEGCI